MPETTMRVNDLKEVLTNSDVVTPEKATMQVQFLSRPATSTLLMIVQ